jgi:UDP-N-acetylmuramoylalanine--D-glutamate ligase
MTDYAGKTIVVIGMARTGLAVASAMRKLGANVVLYDHKPESELAAAISQAHELGVETRLGSIDVSLDGADMLVPSPGVPAHIPVFAEARRRGIPIISEIELAYRIAQAPIIGITGTNGKTTTTVLTGRMFQADARETAIAGNVVAGDIRKPLITAALETSADGFIVAEISTFQLEWISDFRPRVAALLNVTADHLDRHSGVEEYANLKARIFANQTPNDFAIINSDNPFTASLAQSLNGRVMRFSRIIEPDEGGFIRGDELVIRHNGDEFVICRRSDILLRGEHNVENILAAACAAIALGVETESVLNAIRGFHPIEHRLEPVAVIDGVEYINNSMCTNIDAAVRSIEAIREPQIVIAGGKEKGLDFAPLAASFVRKVKHVVLIGADADLIHEAARSVGYDHISRAGSMNEAVDIARSIAVPGDVVVLTPACASFDMFSSFEERGQAFKQIVMDYAREGCAST